MKIHPLEDRVVIEVLEEEEKTKGGIFIPDAAKEKRQEGKVIAVGEGKTTENGKTVPLKVKVGDKVLYGGYSSAKINIDDKEYLIVKYEDIEAVMK